MEPVLNFSPITKAHLVHLWTNGHRATGWPLRDLSWQAFEAWGMNFNFSLVSEFDGLATILIDNQTCIGFVTRQMIPPEYLPSNNRPDLSTTSHFPIVETALECGTYLLPSYRGHGLNALIKEKLIQAELNSCKCQVLAFVVPLANQQAQRAMRKLPWRVETVSSDAQPSSHPFARFARFRAYQESTRVDVFLYSNDYQQ